jgi:hypothetical protein
VPGYGSNNPVGVGHFFSATTFRQSRDSSVGIKLDYGLDDQGSRFRYSAGAGKFSLHHRAQNGSEAHQASYPMRSKGSFPGGKEAGV